VAALCPIRTQAAPASGGAGFKEPKIDRKAKEVLQQMCKTLAGAKQITVKGTRLIDKQILRELQILPYADNASFEAAVWRPQHIWVKVQETRDRRELFSNGTTTTLYEPGVQAYVATSTVHTIDAILALVEEKLKFRPPAADFLVSDPYPALLRDVSRVTYEETMDLDGTQCDVLRFQQLLIDKVIYVARVDWLPRRVVYEFKVQKGPRPRFSFNFNSWNLNPTLSLERFEFKPPDKTDRVQKMPVN
jgi:hypothetical protein